MPMTPGHPDYMDLLPPSVLQRVGRLDLLARHAKEGFIVGRHKSPYKGFSAEFSEHRQYVQGDDIRGLDWRVYARSDRYYVKQFEDETNLRTTILLDVSGSMDYAGERAMRIEGRPIAKFEYARRLAAALTYLLVNQQDAVGLVTFDTEARRYVPARAMPTHLHVILEELYRTRPGGESSIAPVFHDIAERIHRRGLVIVISDLYDDLEALVKSLHHFCYRKHELMVLHVVAEEELTFPFERWMDFRDLEITKRKVLIDTGSVRAEYLERVQEFVQRLVIECGRMKVDYIPFCTRDPYDLVLANYLMERRQR